jgi:phytoene synthase
VRVLARYAPTPVLFERRSSEVEQSYRRCREITKSSSKTFYFASLFLPAEKRKAIWAVYAFCRTVDDIADASCASHGHLAELDAWEKELVRAFDGRPEQSVTLALAETARRYPIPIRPALELLEGARKDVAVQRYATYDELLEYCYLVASTVGLLVSPILGYAPGALEYGVALGRAMQLTNILRDVGEDARMGRIYLPAEDIERFGYSEEKLLRGAVDAQFVALMRFEIARVRQIYRAAAPGIALLARESRYTVRLALALYGRILDAIEANGYDVFTRRAHVPLHAKLAIALATALER